MGWWVNSPTLWIMQYKLMQPQGRLQSPLDLGKRLEEERSLALIQVGFIFVAQVSLALVTIV